MTRLLDGARAVLKKRNSLASHDLTDSLTMFFLLLLHHQTFTIYSTGLSTMLTFVSLHYRELRRTLLVGYPNRPLVQ